ncbi:MAG: adenosine kinase [Bacteriovoracaceae bacterium]|nr:adenosine kinase [Bacteriovoracaceae bacterium]
MKKYNVYGMGNALVDIEVLVDQNYLDQMEMEKGVMCLVPRERQSQILDSVKKLDTTRCCGGSAANTVIGMAQLGGRSFYSCRVGGDKLGDFYLGNLLGHGIATNIDVDRPAVTTGTCVVMVTPDADRTMNTHLGISRDFCSDQLIPEEIAKSEYFYIEGYLLYGEEGTQAALEGVRIARENGVKIALTLSDKNLVINRREQVMSVIGEGVDAIFCNLDEARAFSGGDTPEECSVFMQKYANTFGITLGDKGALVYDGSENIMVTTASIKAIDTLGAGDLFAGSFLYAITHGHSYTEAGRFACRTASVLCSQYGTRLPTEKLLEIKKEILG